MTGADLLESMRRSWRGVGGQMVTMESLTDRYPKWAARLVRELGDLDPCREVIWI